VLHCLRDRLTVNEAAQLADQFPMLIRGIYYEVWHPAGKPEKLRSREEFLAKLGSHLPKARAINPEDAVRAVKRHQDAIHTSMTTFKAFVLAAWLNVS
jgi:uncharacterized protein (DUF2267 family)